MEAARKKIPVAASQLEAGGNITWLGVRVADMTREEMIGFIFQLDRHIGNLAKERVTPEEHFSRLYEADLRIVRDPLYGSGRKRT
jgi:hypothetical protein